MDDSSWIKNRGKREDKESLSWIKDETKSHVVMLDRGTPSGGPSLSSFGVRSQESLQRH